MNKFIDRLNELIKETNKPQNQIAEELGITKQKLNQWKTGYIKTPAIDDLILLAKYFKVSIDYLVGYETEDGRKCSEEFEIIKKESKIKYKKG